MHYRIDTLEVAAALTVVAVVGQRMRTQEEHTLDRKHSPD